MDKNRGGYVRRAVRRYWIFYLSSFIFKENHILIEEVNPPEKYDSQGRTRWYWYRNLEDLIRKLFIPGECGNLKGFVNGGELTRHINENKKPGV